MSNISTMKLRYLSAIALVSVAMASCTDNKSRAIEIVNQATVSLGQARDSTDAIQIVNQAQKDIDDLHLTVDQQRELAADPAYKKATEALTKAARDKKLPI